MGSPVPPGGGGPPGGYPGGAPVPFVPGVYQPNSTIAELILRAGQQRAESQQRMYEGLGNTVAQLGQIPTQIQQSKLLQARTALEQARGEREASETKRQQDERDAIDAALKPNPDGTSQTSQQAMDALKASGKGHLAASVGNALNLADEAGYKAKALRQASVQKDIDYGATLGFGLQDRLQDPDPEHWLSAAGIAVKHAQEYEHPDAPQMAAGYQQLLQSYQQAKQSGDPQALADATGKLKSTLNGVATNLTQGASTDMLEKLRKLKEPIEGKPGTTFFDPVTHQPMFSVGQDLSKSSLDEQLAAAAPGGAKPNPARYQELLGIMKTSAAAKQEGRINVQVGTGLNQDALDKMVDSYVMTGQRPMFPMRGAAGAQMASKFANRLAEKYPDLIPGETAAQFKSNAASMTKLQAQTDAVTAFESVATKNSALLEDAIKNMPDLGVKFLNRPIRALAGQLGSEDMAKINVLRQSVQNEYSRIISNPTLSGTMSDTARKEGENLLSGDLTVGQLRTALKTFASEAANRREGYTEQLEAVKNRIHGLLPGSGGEQTKTPTVAAAPKPGEQTATGPNGQKLVLRNGQWVPL